MKLKIILVSIVILTAVFLSAFGSPAAPQTVKLQNTVLPPATIPAGTLAPPSVTLVPATVIVQTTPAAVPVTGEPNPTLWTIILFALLGLLALAFLVALFSPRTPPDNIDRNGPPDV